MQNEAAFERDVIDAFFQSQLTGDGIMLLEAVRRCGQYGIPIPRMVYEVFDDAVKRYMSGEARTIDEAFSVKREKSWNQTGHRNSSKSAWNAYVETRRLHELGHPIDMELHQLVGDKFNISAATARKYWRQVSKEMTTK